MGRPTKLTEDRTDLICQAIQEGTTVETACQLAGITERTYYNYRARAEEAMEKPQEERTEIERQYIRFFRATTGAVLTRKKKVEKTLVDAALNGDWRAALKFLERRHPEEWGSTTTVRHKQDPIQIEWADDEEIEADVEIEG